MKTKQTPVSKTLLGLSRLLVRGLCPGVLAFAPAAWAITETFTPGTHTWTVPAGVTSVAIETRGGGGAGGAASRTTTRSKGGGGAGGSFAKVADFGVTAGQTYKVVVGAGGVSDLTGIANGNVLPGQKGGDSKFSSSDELTNYCVAVGGKGGANSVDGSGADPFQPLGGAGSTVGNVGDSPFRQGGSGSQGPANNSGGGGGGAGNVANGTGANQNNGGAGGNAGGGAGASGRNSNGSGAAATAVGFGGGGAGACQLSGAAASAIGGAGGNGQVQLTYTVQLGVDNYAVTVANSSQTAGAAFDVTITAKDINNTTVPDTVNVVTMTSPDGSLMEFDWNNDTIFGDNSGTLIPSALDITPVAGQRTIKARNRKAEEKTLVATSGLITTTTPPAVTTAPAAFTKLQILAPGEIAAPGTLTGKTGTPTATFSVSFDVTVNGVDDNWNLVNTVTDTVAISTTAPASVLPADTALVDGTEVFPVALNSLGSFTLTATDQTPGNGTQFPDTTPLITVQPVTFVWKGDGVANQWDTTTLNWDSPNGTGVPFVSGNNVLFDASSSNQTVDLVGSVTAATITANSGLEYTLGSTNSGSITGGTAIAKFGSGRLTLSTANDNTGAIAIFNSGALRAAATQALGSGTITINGGSGTKGGLELIGGISLNNPVNFFTKISSEGISPGIRNISGDNALTGTIGTSTSGDYFMIQSDAGLLTLGTTGSNAFTFFGGKFLFLRGVGNGLFAGNITSGSGSHLTKDDAGTWTIGGSTSHTASTTINGGTLALGASGSITASSSLTIAAGATFDTSAVTTHTIPAARPLTFGINATDSGSSGKIAAAGLDISAAVVTAYTITGTPDDPAYVLATYTSLVGTPSFASVPTPPAGYTLDYAYQGNKIALVGGSDPFLSWAANDPGVLFGGDQNNDGVENGLAWLLGAADPNVSALSKLPVITQTGGNLKMTFDMLPASARGTSQLFIESSTNLGTWSAGVLVPDADGGTAPVTFVVTGTNPLDVEATISSSEAVAGKLFGRLKAVR